MPIRPPMPPYNAYPPWIYPPQALPFMPVMVAVNKFRDLSQNKEKVQLQRKGANKHKTHRKYDEEVESEMTDGTISRATLPPIYKKTLPKEPKTFGTIGTLK